MGILQDFLSSVDNMKRVAKQNISDVINEPEGMAGKIKAGIDKQIEDPANFIPGGGMTGTIGSAARILGEDAWLKAVNMIGKKATPEEVFAATKAYVGPLDQQLKANISDAGAKLKPTAPDATNLRVGDVLDHPELYKHYPDLSSLRLVKEDLPAGHWGSFNPKDGILKVNKNQPESDQMLTILHELQHGIQNIEGFSSGSNIQSMASSPLFLKGMSDPETIKELIAQKTQTKDKRSVAGILAEKLYRLVAGEAEARAVEKQFINKDWNSMPTQLYDVPPDAVIPPR